MNRKKKKERERKKKMEDMLIDTLLTGLAMMGHLVIQA